MNVELALQINRLIHNECKDVPHDIGLRIEQLISENSKYTNKDLCEFAEWCSDNDYTYLKNSDLWMLENFEFKTTSDLQIDWEIETGRRPKL